MTPELSKNNTPFLVTSLPDVNALEITDPRTGTETLLPMDPGGKKALKLTINQLT